MKVLYVRTGRMPEELDIDSGLDVLQELVGGNIELVYPFTSDDDIALICNEEGKVTGKKLNRAIYSDETGELMDIIAGNFLIVRSSPYDEDFSSLTEAQLKRYKKRFAHPEDYVVINGNILRLG